MDLPSNINLIYFDAFSPDKQPECWSEDIISSIGKVSEPGAILVTYSSKGIVRRTLAACGFEVYKVPGPPGKREMIRAIKR
jgi:tRNA U34 5-methylaminomethyl-2-thiouridine-forming methyltransferase MnmC